LHPHGSTAADAALSNTNWGREAGMALVFFDMGNVATGFVVVQSTGAEYNQRPVRDATFSYQPNSQ
jgi:hypothetical protein